MENKFIEKNNIIFICTDGLRRDVINDFESIKKLSKKGTIFPNVVTYAPYTIASLHSIFTGIYGNRNGVNNYYGSVRFKNKECKTLTSYLKDEGYYTIGDIINELVVPSYGFDSLSIQDSGKDILPTHKDIIKKCGAIKKSGNNFFAFLHCDYIHDSLVRNVISKYDDFSKEYFENIKDNRKRYYAYVKKIVKYLDEIFQDIKRENIEDSIIVIFSDHGCSLGERLGEKVYGSFCYDYTIMTFAIFILNGLFENREVTNLVRTVDFMPTILEILRIPLDNNSMKLDGKSLVSLINDKESISRIGFSETAGLEGPYASPNLPNVHCVRTERWKLIFNKIPKTYELYDIENDPNEADNLYNREKYFSIQKYLLNKLRRNLIKIKN